MALFTTNKLIILSLILIIGLAIIAYNGKCNEGYDNTNTMYSEYMKRIEPTIRAINYFSGKSVRVCAKSGDFSQIWITDEYKRTTYTQMDVYDGSKIPSEMAARLEKKLLEGFKTGETKQTFDDDPLRILRALRFSITKGFVLSSDIHSQIKNYDYDSKMGVVSTERIREELFKCFKYDTLKTLKMLHQYPDLTNYIFSGNTLWLKPTTEQ